MGSRKGYKGAYRVDPQPCLDFRGELDVDLFAGGGGASTGMEWALGKSPDIAVNHNIKAIRMHEINHPHTKHFCESVFAVDPLTVCGDRPIGHLWMSPDCTHFSKAKGSTPVSKRVRGLAWVGIRWAAVKRPRVIFLENVEEFQTWGPLVRINGEYYPCKKRAGRTFRSFVRELQRLGYEVEWRTMRACDYGAPTIRKRLFLVARCDGQPIVWPEPTHGDPSTNQVKSGILKPWRTAAECIDWSVTCPSIFTRKRPLAENTLRRIAKGIKRYVIDNPTPYIVPTSKKGKVLPYLTEHANASNARVFDINEPLRTQCAQTKGGHFALIAPTISTYYGPKGGNHHRGQEMNEPLRTQTTENRFALQAATLLKHYGGVVGTKVDYPTGTITTTDHHSLATAHLVRHFGESTGTEPGATDGTGKTGLVSTTLIRNYGNGMATSIDRPLPTITTKGKESLATSHLVKLRGTCKDGQRSEDTMPTITAGGTHIGEVRTFLLKYNGNEGDPRLEEPLHTITTKDRFGLVTVDGQTYEIADIGMRMLKPRELYRAQGFPESYIIDHIIVDGKETPLTITDQVQFVGNSVSPYNAAALIAANAGRSLTAIAA